MGRFPGGNIVRITPTCSTDTDTTGDIIFDSTEIPGAVSNRGGTAILRGVSFINYNDTDANIDVIFMENQVNLGTAGAAITVADSVVASAKLIGFASMDSSDGDSDLINSIFCQYGMSSETSTIHTTLPMMIKAGGNSTSVYFTAIDRSGSLSFAADGLEFIFHIEYID